MFRELSLGYIVKNWELSIQMKDDIALRKYIKTIAEGSMYTNFYILNADVLTSMCSATLFLLETPVHPPHLEPRFVKNYQAIGSKASLSGLSLLLRKMRVRHRIAIRG